jgi:DNA-binding CsgD family transcriptional regulator
VGGKMRAFHQKIKPIPKYECGVLSLTRREKETVISVSDGFTNKEIGVKMNITREAVKNHLRKIFDKLGLDKRLELALWYVSRELGEVQDPEFVLAFTTPPNPVSPSMEKQAV